MSCDLSSQQIRRFHNCHVSKGAKETKSKYWNNKKNYKGIKSKFAQITGVKYI